MNQKRYLMCADQPAQIDCRIEECVFHKHGSCTNVSPAITLNQNGFFTCWSEIIRCTYCDKPATYTVHGYIEEGQDGRYANNPCCTRHVLEFQGEDKQYKAHGFVYVDSIKPLEQGY